MGIERTGARNLRSIPTDLEEFRPPSFPETHQERLELLHSDQLGERNWNADGKIEPDKSTTDPSLGSNSPKERYVVTDRIRSKGGITSILKDGPCDPSLLSTAAPVAMVNPHRQLHSICRGCGSVLLNRTYSSLLCIGAQT